MSEPRLEWGFGEPPAEYAVLDGDAGDLPGEGAEWGVAFVGARPAARLATYVRDDLQGAPGTSGLVGHYAARDEAAGVALLRTAARRLRERRAARVLGPMNGSTWARYRLALPPEQGHPLEPPFLGEPVNPAEYPRHFAAAGYAPVASYESRITRGIAAANPRAVAAEAAAAERGVLVAPLDMARFDDELRALHALSLRAFAGNLFYSPIGLPAFEAIYRPMRALIDPGLVLVARGPDGAAAGYVFAYADPLALADGRPYRLIVKTLAVDPDWRSFGLGALLVERLHEAARDRGLTAVVHALMHADNNSVRISAHTTEVFRRYALYGDAGSC